ncbi:MAG: uracil-DNA glycosylase [Desulfovibrionaceae bacterium]
MSHHIDTNKLQMSSCWKEVLQEEFTKEYFLAIKKNYIESISRKAQIYPPANKVFNAFMLTPFTSVKVIILGQDPYHNKGQAMGLSFSVPKEIAIPPSLQNIFKEITRSLLLPMPQHGDLSSWAAQGVFLLNTSLTVEANKANSHKDWGWNTFTNAVISILSKEKKNLVFLLWGNHARAKKEYIDSSQHTILESKHPSPLAGNAFVGNNHFLHTNVYLEQHGLHAIDWSI